MNDHSPGAPNRADKPIYPPLLNTLIDKPVKGALAPFITPNSLNFPPNYLKTPYLNPKNPEPTTIVPI